MKKLTGLFWVFLFTAGLFANSVYAADKHKKHDHDRHGTKHKQHGEHKEHDEHNHDSHGAKHKEHDEHKEHSEHGKKK